MIHRTEHQEARNKAFAVLARAKEIEARRMAAGAKYKRINGTTIVLKDDSSKAKPTRKKAQ